MNEWYHKRIVVSYLIQIPNKANGFTTGYRKLFAIGGSINKEGKRLWCYSSKKINLGILQIEINSSPEYYEDIIKR